MKKKTEYKEFDPVDELRSEVAFEEYILALREADVPEWLIQSAYRDIERARIVHGIPKPATATAAATTAAAYATT